MQMIKVVITCQLYTTNELVSSNVVKVHHHNVERAFPDLFPWYVEWKTLVEYWIKGALEYRSLTFLDSLVTELEPNFDVGIFEKQTSL